MRRSGVLLHITSLPSPGGIGTLGRAAYEFVDFMARAGLSVWQMLPIGPTGYGESPYQSASTHAGNPMLIDLPLLAEEGLLRAELPELPGDPSKADFDAVRREKEKQLRLSFEQSYGGVDGDSASSTELYALLSSLSGLPIQQRFAVTGSVNQRGQVQPIGGANQKIEGFFAVCKAKGLRGDEGVLIPRTNVPNLMLRSEVRDAIAAGTFHIYPISTFDEGIALMTATPAGEADENGVYPEGTVNRMVADRLADLTAKARALREDKSKPRPKKKPAKGQPKPQEDPEI